MTERDEGVIKFNIEWDSTPHTIETLNLNEFKNLLEFRNQFFKLGLIGEYDDGIGYGNISIKLSDESDLFLISGSATGGIENAHFNDFALVTHCQPNDNKVRCIGPVKASSESMTHHMIYQLHASIKVVVHVHHQKLWEKYKYQLPTTGKDIPYGTPAMATEMNRLFQESDLPQSKVLVMAGHDDGLICFGENFKEVFIQYQSLLNLL